MQMNIVAPQPRHVAACRIRMRPKKYSGQVRLAPDRRDLIGFRRGGSRFRCLEFLTIPTLRPKSCGNQYFKPIATDDFDLRFFRMPGGEGKIPARNSCLMDAGPRSGIWRATPNNRAGTEVEPLPADPDFRTTGIWSRSGAYPSLAPRR